MKEPNWIVNDNGELGVEINGRCFFLYKGRSLEYTEGQHDDGTPILIRRVGKREFGETQWPEKWLKQGRRLARYTENVTYDPLLNPGSLDKEYCWHPIQISSPQSPDNMLEEMAALLRIALQENPCDADAEIFTVANPCTEGECWHAKAKAILKKLGE